MACIQFTYDKRAFKELFRGMNHLNIIASIANKMLLNIHKRKAAEDWLELRFKERELRRKQLEKKFKYTKK